MIIARGHLWTARQAEEEMGLPRCTVDAWKLRGYITPAVTGRPALYWSDDLYDSKRASRLQRQTRDTSGRFGQRIATGPV